MMGAETIKLRVSRGLFVTLDASDWERVKPYRWYIDGRNYAYCRPDRSSTSKVYLHRFLSNLKRGDGLVVDHIDGDPLNCCRGNLRVCTQRNNMRNRRKMSDSLHTYKGVSFNAKSGKWAAHISVGGFATEAEAAREYDRLAASAHGEFARFNFNTPSADTMKIVG